MQSDHIHLPLLSLTPVKFIPTSISSPTPCIFFKKYPVDFNLYFPCTPECGVIYGIMVCQTEVILTKTDSPCLEDITCPQTLSEEWGPCKPFYSMLEC